MNFREPAKHNHLLSLFAIIVIVTVSAGVIFNLQRWQNPMQVIQWDIKSYYAYLPAILIYGDHTLEFTKEDPEFFADKFWPLPTPTGGQSIVTSMGLAFCYLPFFLMGHFAAWLTGAEMNGFSPPYAFFLTISALVYVFLGMLALRKVLLRYFSNGITALTLVAMFFATNLFYYTVIEGPMSHAYSFALFAWFILLTINWHENPTLKKSLVLGLLSGLIVLIRPTNILILLFFLLYQVHSAAGFRQRINFLFSKYKLVGLMALAAFAVWVPQMLYWNSVAGQWLYFSYKPGERFFFDNPQIINGLFSYRKGWLLYTPLMVLALAGIVMLWKHLKEYFWPILTFTLLNMYVVLSWWSWWYGGSFGLRAFIESYAVLALPFAALIHHAAVNWKKTAKRIVIALTFLLILHGVFQTAQYYYGAIHWDSMNKTTYWASFGRLRPLSGFYEAISPPDYELAKKGIQATVEREIQLPVKAKSILVDMESIDSAGNIAPSGSNLTGLYFEGLRCAEKAFSGGYSLKVGERGQTSVVGQIPVAAGETWLVSVKTHSLWFNGVLALSGEDGKHFYKDIRVGIPSAKKGWDSLALMVQIPETDITHLRVVLQAKGLFNARFDDLQLHKADKSADSLSYPVPEEE